MNAPKYWTAGQKLRCGQEIADIVTKMETIENTADGQQWHITEKEATGAGLSLQKDDGSAGEFTIEAKAENIFHHRLLLLNRAPYSNIPAEALGLSTEEWLERSQRLRLRHECAHYETLRLLGGMRNHALDEILADAMGQIAAFGDFDADRQRLFFGLEKGRYTCTGRLSYYCTKVALKERPKVYAGVNEVLDEVADELKAMLARKAAAREILFSLAGKSIAKRLSLTGP